jgi:hypothetical protein
VSVAQRRRATYLSPPDFVRLDWACERIRDAFGVPPYLVGSVTERADFRDIDLRLILPDAKVQKLFGKNRALRQLLNVALSDLIQRMASPPAPIDFQIQSTTEANAPENTGTRNPLGVREMRKP